MTRPINTISPMLSAKSSPEVCGRSGDRDLSHSLKVTASQPDSQRQSIRSFRYKT